MQPSATIQETLNTPVAGRYDVIVVGGGASGTVAAIAAARTGARTLLVERGGCLGGAATANLVAQWVAFFHGETRVVGGIPFELAERVQAAGGSDGFHRYVMGEAAGTPFPLRVLPFNPETVKWVLDGVVNEAGVDVLLHTAFARALVQDGSMAGVTVETVQGRLALLAPVVVDASGDALVCASAGVPSQDDGGERQPCTLSFRLSNVDVARFRAVPPDERRARVLGGLQRGELFWESLSFVSTPGGTDAICLMSRIQDIDALDARDASRAEQEGRRQIASIVGFLRREIPGFGNAILADIAERVGVRETRRIQGRYTLSEEDIMQARGFDDAIALGAGPMDRHQPGGTGIRLYAPPEPFEIPLRALLPVGVEGLLVCGRTLSATREAMAGARHMATSMAMGQAVGTLGAIAAASGRRPSSVPAAEVQQDLARAQALFRRAQAAHQPA
ncbi:FAD-dependent oxidoreductase [Pigmentiphaga sp.]|uniref:FAD-dependent oxidoreductase n=1 Tax=Pigmentiphaga sp. TaxID=1977564 RepID=UPI00128E065D|nr:FAD-dependent oxidoreductase [Pigmentiphaga sp.]MPS29893.1 FAD-dependent oxidoreductase [Alcaligenaceae bacterium SAGV5]MPS54895.1 FAD-dependent oxidoreductase [Alcaligenaceae bacterium SAGV3]MPT56456.1 FAD-dependent oxidoreductase [Alcaligenaceae bacterium]